MNFTLLWQPLGGNCGGTQASLRMKKLTTNDQFLIVLPSVLTKMIGF